MPSQICPLCHQEAPGTARFCPNCASPLRPDVTPPPTPQPSGMPLPAAANRTATQLDVAAWRSQRILVLVLVLALVVVGSVAAYYVHQNSLVNAERSRLVAPPLIGANTPTLAGPSVVAGQQAPLPAGAPVLGAQGKQGTNAPADVLAYLNFLGQIEAQRVTLKNNLNSALAMLGAAKGMEGATEDNQQQGAKSQINSGYTDYTGQWQQLVRTFQSQQPPAQCESLANDYYRLLTDYANYISQIQVAMQNKDLNTLMNLQGTAEVQIDTDAVNADNALSQICQKYGIQKPFNIQPDNAGAGTSVLGP